MRAAVVVLIPLVTFALAGCNGCAEECLGDNRAATCPCGSDQDCSTRDEILMCVDGSCQPGVPDQAPNDLGACDVDADCGRGAACGADGACQPAADCQRIEVALRGHVAAGSEGDVVPVLDGCTHTWTAIAGGSSLNASFTIGIDGVFTFVDEGCEEGRWLAGRRIGEMLCDDTTWAIVPADGSVLPCVGDECDAGCTVVGAAVGVCAP